MKKLTAFVAALFAFVLSIALAGNVVELSQIGLTVDIPADYDYITLNSTQDNAVLQKKNTSKGDFDAYMQTNELYLYGINSKNSNELTIGATKFDYDNFDGLDNTSIKESISSAVDSEDIILVRVDVTKIEGKKYVLVLADEKNDEGKLIRSVRYYLVENGILYSCALYSNDNKISNSQINTLTDIVKSAKVSVVELQKETVVESTPQPTPLPTKTPIKTTSPQQSNEHKTNNMSLIITLLCVIVVFVVIISIAVCILKKEQKRLKIKK